MSLSTLADAADLAVFLARQDNSTVSGATEPDQVARLVAKLPKHLVAAWQPFVATGALTVSAAFCHFKPQVRWNSPFSTGKKEYRPELADLLVIFDVPQPAGRRAERSLLIQAKVSKGGSFSLSTVGDLAQRFMYAHWDPFHVTGLKQGCPPLPVPVNIGDPQKSEQSRYACVDTDSSANPAWRIEKDAATISSPDGRASFEDFPPESLNLSDSMGSGLARMYDGSLGRRSDQPDDWSKLIRYLEAYVSAHCATNKLSHVTSQPGATLAAITSATTFFAGSDTSFPRYRGTRHLLVGMNDWVDSLDWFRPCKDKTGKRLGLVIDWPGVPWDEDQEGQPGFAVLRVVVEQPLLIANATN